MRILRPIKTNRVTQGFGESKACVQQIDGRSIVVAKLADDTCPTGFKDLYKSLGLLAHNGVDNATWRGEPLYFPVVETDTKWWCKSEVDSNGGIGIDVVSEQLIDGSYLKFRFWHLQKVVAADNTEVIPGQLLGFCNSTGLSGGDHVHWAMKRVDAIGNPVNRDNGYYGAEDFSQWFENQFIIDYLQLKNAEIQIKEAQLTFIQILNKFLFILREQIRKAAAGLGGLFQKNE